MTPEDRVQAVVVHHRSPWTLPATVAALVSAGIPPARILVVDNSPADDPDLDLGHQRVRIRRSENRGYAAAANLGLKLLSESGSARYTLICSHEAQITHESLEPLIAVLDADDRVAVAGPTLLIADTHEIWSTGGYLSRHLHLARHTSDQSSRVESLVDRDWLDGALTIYRTELLEAHPFDERYFLYFEETDLHTRLRRAGHRVVWVPAAIGTQTSSGIPPYLLGRNTMLFHAAHFTRWSGRRAVVFESGRLLARKLLTRRGEWRALSQVSRGWRVGERELSNSRAQESSP